LRGILPPLTLSLSKGNGPLLLKALGSAMVRQAHHERIHISPQADSCLTTSGTLYPHF
jgi:hypothetical protein